MPKLCEIIERIPELPAVSRKPDLKIVKEWDERYSPTHDLHYIEYEDGYKQASFRAIR